MTDSFELMKRYKDPQTASVVHVPGLERWAENQRPKSHNWRDLKLYRYVGTHLHQWHGKQNGSVFEDAFGVPFLIEPRDEPLYMITSGGEGVFEGTVAQADNVYGLRIGATEDDVLDFVQTSKVMPDMALWKKVI